MTGPPTWVTGNVPGGGDFDKWFQASAAFKPADSAPCLTTTLATDPDLQVTFAANSAYTFIGSLLYTAANGGDIQFQFTGFAGGALLRYAPIRQNLSASFVGAFADTGATNETANGSGSGTLMVVTMIGSLQTFSVGGTMQLQWAQASSSATPTVVKAQSHLTLIAIS